MRFVRTRKEKFRGGREEKTSTFKGMAVMLAVTIMAMAMPFVAGVRQVAAADPAFSRSVIDNNFQGDAKTVGDMAASSNSGLVGYWKFDETSGTSASDSSDNNHSGTLTNGPTWAAGHLNNAVSLDGSNDYVNMGNDPSLNLTGSFTLSAWVYPRSLSGGDKDIITRVAGDVGYWLQVTGSNIQMGFYNQNWYYVNSSGSLPLNTWSYVTGVFDDDANQMRVYINGVQNAVSSVTASPRSANSETRIGLGWSGQYWNGMIDEARIYSRALSASEVVGIMNDTGTDTAPPVRSNGVPSGTLALGTTQTTISLSTNEQATCRYATAPGVPYASMTFTFGTTGETSHSTMVTGLADGQAYSYYVRCQDSENNTNADDYSISFSVAAPDTQSPVISSVAASASDSTSTVTWTTNEASDSQVEYGLTTSYGSSTTPNASLVTSHSVNLSGLSANTLYHYRVKSKDGSGNPSVSGDFTFTTSSYVPHIGIMGDSASDEYRADDNRGGAYASTTFNEIELLQRYRGLDFGVWGTRSEPRRTGYAYNWARSGATAADVVTTGQHTGLAAQVAAGQVNTAFLFVGANDFAIWNGTYAAVYNGTVSGSALTAKINGIVSNITTAVDTVRSAGDVRMAVFNLADRGQSAYFQAQFPDPVKRQRATDAVIQINAGIQAMVNARPGVALIDYFNLGSAVPYTVDANGNVIIGGQAISMVVDGDEPHHAILADHDHVGTVLTGVIANLTFIDVLNSAFNANIAPFSDQELLANAGIDTLAPSVPGNVFASAVSTSQINLSWSASSDNVAVAGYRVFRGGVQIATTTATSYNNTGLSPATAYSYAVQAYDTSGNSSAISAAAQATTLTVDATPPVISGVAAGSITAFAAAITWTTDEASDSQVEYGTTSSYGSSTTLNTSLVTSHSVILSGLSANTSYHYRVKSKDSSGNLAVSGDFTFTTAEVPAGPAGLIHHWKFDETSGTSALNSATTTANGTLTNGPTWVAGHTGNGIRLDGSNDYVNLPSALNVSGNAITMAAWVKLDVVSGTSDARFLSKASNTSEAGHYWMLGQSGNRLRFRLRTGSNTTTLVASSGNLSANTWYHVAATYDGSTMRLYLNGVLVGSTGKTGNIATSNSVPVSIGRNPDGSNYFDGIIDDMRIYNRALSATEISAIMNEN